MSVAVGRLRGDLLVASGVLVRGRLAVGPIFPTGHACGLAHGAAVVLVLAADLIVGRRDCGNAGAVVVRLPAFQDFVGEFLFVLGVLVVLDIFIGRCILIFSGGFVVEKEAVDEFRNLLAVVLLLVA
jgi:hypothetical protein